MWVDAGAKRPSEGVTTSEGVAPSAIRSKPKVANASERLGESPTVGDSPAEIVSWLAPASVTPSVGVSRTEGVTVTGLRSAVRQPAEDASPVAVVAPKSKVVNTLKGLVGPATAGDPPSE